jgi:hypothetical protein
MRVIEGFALLRAVMGTVLLLPVFRGKVGVDMV